ncbi:MAG: 50S ribosomal protein L3 [Bdellovibrionaceae bacterium]|nr:50S ribosomal protein L3 [Pseudobdellovibrionaceae bacterium]
MSEQNATDAAASSGELKLAGLYAFKEGMATVYNDQGEAVPVTILRYEPWFVSQIKTEQTDGYTALQVACRPRKAKNTNKAEKTHLAGAGFENGAQFVREIRQEIPADAKVGARVSIESLTKGDEIRITGRSKGRGFQGSVRRWNFAGGPASHGSKFHRRPGSSGNRTWPGRVMPGKKFPGHWGDETVTVKNVVVVDVLPAEGVVMVKGPVPGARNSLVKLVRG